MSETKVLELVGLIYDAAENASGWPVLLEGIGRALGATACGLLIVERLDPSASMSESAGLDPFYLAQYAAYYNTVDAFVTRSKSHFVAGKVLASHETIPDRSLRASEFYNDFLRPQNLFYQATGIIAANDSSKAVITSMRPVSAGPFTDGERDLIHALMPHLNRAVRVHRGLGMAATSESALDSLAVGVVFVTALGKVIWANTCARKILGGRDGIWMDRRGLLATSSNRAALLAQCAKVGAVLRGSAADAAALAVKRPSGKRPYCLQFSPVRARRISLGSEQAEVVIFISDPEQSKEPPTLILQRLFGLTLGEAKIAAALLLTNDLNRACESLSIRRNTGRAHLRSLFTKLGVKRQGELVALLLRAVGPVESR